MWEPEIYRIKGELLRTQDMPDESETEAAFRKAIVVAQAQHAKSWELRAAMSLSRLWKHQGKRQEARDLLAPVYGWSPRGLTRQTSRRRKRCWKNYDTERVTGTV